jgi:hypothetical protein
LVATLYATGRRGQILVLDIPDEEAEMRVSKEFWFDRRAKRLMIWRKFDDYIVGIIPARELRKIVRAKGMAAMSETDRSDVLKGAIDKALRGAAALPITTLDAHRDEFASLSDPQPGMSHKRQTDPA